MRFPLIAIGNSSNTILDPGEAAPPAFSKRESVRGLPSKAQALQAGRTAPQILAITVPLAAAFTSMTWAIATYFIVRERYRAQIEQARLEAEVYKAGYTSKEPPVLRTDDRSMTEHPIH